MKYFPWEVLYKKLASVLTKISAEQSPLNPEFSLDSGSGLIFLENKEQEPDFAHA